MNHTADDAPDIEASLRGDEEAFRRIQSHIYGIWKQAEEAGKRYFPHEFMYKLLLSGDRGAASGSELTRRGVMHAHQTRRAPGRTTGRPSSSLEPGEVYQMTTRSSGGRAGPHSGLK